MSSARRLYERLVPPPLFPFFRTHTSPRRLDERDGCPRNRAGLRHPSRCPVSHGKTPHAESPRPNPRLRGDALSSRTAALKRPALPARMAHRHGVKHARGEAKVTSQTGGHRRHVVPTSALVLTPGRRHWSARRSALVDAPCRISAPQSTPFGAPPRQPVRPTGTPARQPV